MDSNSELEQRLDQLGYFDQLEDAKDDIRADLEQDMLDGSWDYREQLYSEVEEELEARWANEEEEFRQQFREEHRDEIEEELRPAHEEEFQAAVDEELENAMREGRQEVIRQYLENRGRSVPVDQQEGVAHVRAHGPSHSARDGKLPE